MDKREFKVFYSWQSYIGGKANREYIQEQIQDTCNKLNLNVSIFEDSRGTTGASDIPDTILSKISQSDLFICDVTPVMIIDLPNGKKRAIPNPNVMFELGFAIRCIGWNMVLCVANFEYGDVEFMPFDISKHKILTYKKKEDSLEPEIPLIFEEHMKEIVEHYDELIEQRHSFEFIKHDIDIFNRLMSMMSEKDLINSMIELKISRRYNQWNSGRWHRFISFQDYPENRFIKECLNVHYKEVCMALDNLISAIYPIMNPFNTQHWLYLEDNQQFTPQEQKAILKTQQYALRNLAYPEHGTDENERSLYKQSVEDERTIDIFSNKVIEVYTRFRDEIKRILFI